MIVYMKDWFFEKKKKEYSYISIFNNGSEVVDETEKAYKLYVEYESVDGERSGFTNIWCPKSCALSEEEHKKEMNNEYQRYENGCKAYESMIEFAQKNGVKGVRTGLRKTTILKKIHEAGLEFQV